MKRILKKKLNINLVKALNILIFITIIINPILDIYWFNNTYALSIFNVTIPTIIRFILLSTIAIIFVLKYRKFKFFIGYGILLIAYLIFQYLNCNFGNYNFFLEIRYVLVLAYPIFLLYVIIHTEIDKNLIKKALIILACLISFLIIIPTIFGFAICSYSEKIISGTFFDWFQHDMNYLELASRGIFYTSITGSISLILIPVVYYLYYKEDKVFYLILTFMLVLSCLMVGTRACSYGSILAFIISIIFGVLFGLLDSNKINLKKIMYSLIFLVILIFVFFNAPIISRTKNDINKKDKVINSLDYKLVINNEIINCSDYTNDILIAKIKELKNIYINDQFIYEFYSYKNDPQFWCDIINNYDLEQQSNNRLIEEKMLQRAIYLNNNNDKFWGYGFSKTTTIFNLEKDFLYQYYCLGIIGSIITVGIYIFYFILIGCSIIIKKRINYYNFCLMFSLGMFMVYAYYSGNTFNNLSVTISIAILMGLLAHNVFDTKEINEKKITILALHLGTGGVEKYLSSLCKMLQDDYEIEILCTYKLREKPAFAFDDKIKINYLINDKPYKEEFKQALKNRKIRNIIIYGFKNIKVLILKYIKNRKAIKHINSKYVITTRIFHNKLVNEALNDKYIKIATEHNYPQNKKYINRVVKSISNFNYFIVVSSDLKEIYENKLIKPQCIYIPNVIDNLTQITRNNNIKNTLISIGRLSKEKGYEDLIEVVSLIKKEIPNIKLYLIGDGSEKIKLLSKTKELDLTNNIEFLGFLDTSQCNYYMNKSNVYIMTSYTESFGLVLIEAMSNKLPCIAFDSANGAKNLLSNNVGVLIKNRNKKDMVREVIKLLKNKEIQKTYSEKGYNYCQKYLLSNVKKDWLSVLKKDK